METFTAPSEGEANTGVGGTGGTVSLFSGACGFRRRVIQISTEDSFMMAIGFQI